jgi:hypothetical protein
MTLLSQQNGVNFHLWWDLGRMKCADCQGGASNLLHWTIQESRWSVAEGPNIKSPATRKTPKLGPPAKLLGRSCHVLYLKVWPSQKGWLRSRYQLVETSPLSLLQGCAADLRTSLHRMGRRLDGLPSLWSSPFWRAEVDPTGHLRRCTRTLGYMRDMQSLESDLPNATGFDWETSRIEREAGAKWAESNSCRREQAGSTCNPPDFRRILHWTGGERQVLS